MTTKTDIVQAPEATIEGSAILNHKVGGIDLQAPIEAAVALGSEGVEALKGLHAILKDERDHSAMIDFTRAMAALHLALKPIHKNREATIVGRSGSQFKYRYADLANIEKALREAGAFGLGFSWYFDSHYHEAIGGMGDCILTHEAGHSRTSSFPIKEDKRENRAISAGQAERASTSYTDRVTLQRVFGITHLTEDDVDGMTGTSAVDAVTQEQALTLEARCREFSESKGETYESNRDRMLAWANANSLETFPAAKYDKALAGLAP